MGNNGRPTNTQAPAGIVDLQALEQMRSAEDQARQQAAETWDALASCTVTVTHADGDLTTIAAKGAGFQIADNGDLIVIAPTKPGKPATQLSAMRAAFASGQWRTVDCVEVD